MKILTNQSGSLVTQLKVASLRRNEFFVHAKQYVLAAGCLESTRLLLLSDDANPCGLANEADLVGRFYMSHLHGSAGEVEISPRGEPTIWDYEQTPEGVYCKRMVRISEATQQTAELLNFSSILSPPELDNPRHRNGVLSAKYLTNCVISRVAPQTNATVISMAGDLRPLGLRSHLKNIALDFPHVVGFSGKWASNKFAGRRKLLALGLNGGSNIFTLEFDAEQAPNPDSRVVLDDKKDTFGLQRLKVDWRVTDLDVLSALASIEMIGKALTQSGAGRLKIAPDLAPGLTLRKATGGHHIGTTRMAREPYRGVVDEHCQVHGVPNLHISSSSVFATSGYANPTLTVLALAIRLADRLKLVHLRR
jgi:choline dehydrogenase-like flavoprotein